MISEVIACISIYRERERETVVDRYIYRYVEVADNLRVGVKPMQESLPSKKKSRGGTPQRNDYRRGKRKRKEGEAKEKVTEVLLCEFSP